MGADYYAHIVIGVKPSDLSLLEVPKTEQVQRYDSLTGQPYLYPETTVSLYSDSVSGLDSKPLQGYTKKDFLRELANEEGVDEFHLDMPGVFSFGYIYDIHESQLDDVVIGYEVVAVSSWNHSKQANTDFALGGSEVQRLATWLKANLDFPISKAFSVIKPYLVLTASY